MRILLCSATRGEIQPTLDLLHSGFGEATTEVLITGVGAPATTYALTKKLGRDRYDILMQAGIAGSLTPSLPLLTSVAVGSECFGDLGVEEKGFRSIFDLGFGDKDAHPWSDGRLINPHGVLLAKAGLPVTAGVTVQEITTNPERLAHYKNLGAAVESMEGAAFHYVALMEGMPFVQLRTISNEAGVREKEGWKIGPAIEELNRHLQSLLIKLSR